MAVRVRPGAARDHVGGRYGEDVLMVSVRAPAVDGRATEAARQAIARAFGLRSSAVRIVTGGRHRTKVVELEGDPPLLRALAEELLLR